MNRNERADTQFREFGKVACRFRDLMLMNSGLTSFRKNGSRQLSQLATVVGAMIRAGAAQRREMRRHFVVDMHAPRMRELMMNPLEDRIVLLELDLFTNETWHRAALADSGRQVGG